MSEITMSIDRLETIINVFGSFDENLKLIEDEFAVSIIDRNSELHISGTEENVHYAQRTINGLMMITAKGESIDMQNVKYIISLVREGHDDKIGEISRDIICISAKGKPVKRNQQQYGDSFHRPCRDGENISGCCPRCISISREIRQQDNSDTAGC
jgi:phosphate starvation-inducible PhoH-like protein